MKIGIMQPYFCPYLGYWQLMNAVDRYVVYDDVNFIKGGRINRNAILVQGQAHNINLILSGASPNKHINEVAVDASPRAQQKLLKTIGEAYRKAPYYQQVFPLVEQVVTNGETDLGKYLYDSFRIIGGYLGIGTELILSSRMEKDCSLRAHEKVISICKLLGGTEYYNSVSGVPLYEPHRDLFEAAGLELSFPVMRQIEYPQFRNEFVPNLSIIDVMMFNSQERCQELLHEYDLLKKGDVQL